MHWKLVVTLVPTLTIKLTGSFLFFQYFSQIFLEVPKITSPGKTSCPLRWTLYEGKCYYFSTLLKTWDESQKECVSLNSHLAIISSKAELAFLNSRTQNADYFVGLRRRNSNGEWKWIDNTKFDPGIFNVQDKTNDCAAIGLNSTVSRSCSELNRFICVEKV
ncbi:C-type lectin domain family 5 member A-like [Ahaetulla prasina]|uniref:C-type lectin domain family 5 member A-like n=1 Tax=Ahaetulla prasina TaxID=499056 RepID=UPI0026480318|nr:C-type lectin domain family 5 member A-like [Ahaetulla prasina]XP_058029121.1 C-type lectin domain family 5 member A-like [Ahaetulla prasina]XP_058029122.1 C-type lectin domain family 5 member A-like [Ahaetulla prasina]